MKPGTGLGPSAENENAKFFIPYIHKARQPIFPRQGGSFSAIILHYFSIFGILVLALGTMDDQKILLEKFKTFL